MKVAFASFCVIVAVYPLIAPSNYLLGLGIVAGCMAVGTVGLILLLGYAEQLAVGQAGFCMVGGYANAFFCTHYGWDPFAVMCLGALASMLLALAIGWPILKLRGYVLAMASLAMHLMFIVVALEVPITGRAAGLFGIPRFSIFGITFSNNISYYYFVWLLVLITIVVGFNIDRSRVGRSLKAIASDESAAMSTGVDILRYKLQMFVISAALASMSGSLIVHFLRAMDPHVFGFNYDLSLVTAVVIGGLNSVWGGAVGAAAVMGIRETLRGLSLPLWDSVIMGALTVIVLILFPRGIVGFLRAGFLAITSRAKPVRSLPATPDQSALPPLKTKGNGDDLPLLSVTNVSRSFGNLRAVNAVSFGVKAGTITTVIGPNGAGKTTLFNLIGGDQVLDAGTIEFDSQRIDKLIPTDIALLGIARTFQQVRLFENMSILENVMCGNHRQMSSGIFSSALRLPGMIREEQATEQVANDCLRFVGLQQMADLLPGSVSFGHRRMVEIARALAMQPSLILMDEPASGLNDTETEQLGSLIVAIAELGITVLLVEHDMRLVMGLADHVVVMHHGVKIAEGPVDVIRTDTDVVSAYLGKARSEHSAPA